MKWLIIFGIIAFVLYQNQIKDKDESSSASSVSPENQTLAQTLK